MRNAEEFRSMARDALKGKWKIAVLVGLIASLLGAVENMGPEFNVNINASNVKASLNFAGRTIFSTGGDINSDIGIILAGGFTYWNS